MSARTDFTTAQWAALIEAGPAIAVAVASAAGSAGQSETELAAFLELVRRTTAEAAPDDGLLGRLVADIQGRLAAGWRPTGTEPYMDGLEAARKAGAILGVAADPADAAAIRGWLLTAARTVAEAAHEGGVLGVGGAQVSVHERETIQAIADALGTDAGADAE